MNATEAYKKFGNGPKAARALGLTKTTFYRYLDKERASQKKPSLESGGGLSKLRDKFGKAEIEKKRLCQNQAIMEKFIRTILKKNEWMTDFDVKAALNLTGQDFTSLRRDYLHLTIEGKDEARRKTLLWIHPDYMDEARQILMGAE